MTKICIQAAWLWLIEHAKVDAFVNVGVGVDLVQVRGWPFLLGVCSAARCPVSCRTLTSLGGWSDCRA